ncbi:uncharacterized protein LOC106169666 isoform X2 [Lingula anatina]|uniref:Uncharacterized protein LOC106169666 isoform X2 n=1 Tax=Lingula anatina TaxID=7574 RepID=A0A1S3J337_LINAN|nr:uncharacterized protein LOC106169666 isoform X2 [Lingula anatina]|eukprot:XP_013404691.1 uncharacterized protein LOC106169666 isoform X2 [Lingula anatina]
MTEVEMSPVIEANCKFRWPRTVETKAVEVFLLGAFDRDQPICLRWSKSKELYESDYVKVPVGAYVSQLMVDDKTYPLEKFDVRSYTFEVSLEVKEGSEESSVNTVETPVNGLLNGHLQQDMEPKPEEPQGASSAIKRSGLYEELVRHQMTHGEPSWTKEDSYSLKSDISDRGSVDSLRSRDSYRERAPKDLITDKLHTGGDKLYNGGLNDIRNVDNGEGSRHSRSRGSQDALDNLEQYSRHSSTSSRGAGRDESGSYRERSSHYSDRGSQHSQEYERGSHQSDRGSIHSQSSSRQVSRQGSYSSEQELNQVFHSNGRERRPSLERRSLDQDQSREHDRDRTSPAGSKSSHNSREDPGEVHRKSSYHSLPPMPTSQRLTQQDKRSLTPDSYSRVPRSLGQQPPVMSPLVTTRTTPMSPHPSSRSSSRTTTPVVANGNQETAHSREDYNRVQQLEDTVATLKKLLADRDVEARRYQTDIAELSQENGHLKTELSTMKRAGGQESSAYHHGDDRKELEKRFDELLKEKENLATEVWKLKQELEKSQGDRPRDGSGESGHLDNYSPNNPYALQRKIEELESQIQDLQEANETAALEQSKAEKRAQDLGDENATLKTATAGHLQKLQAENQKLQEQILQLNERNTESVLMEDEEELRKEIQRLRTEMRKLRDQNHQVNEENISLRDQLRDSKRREKYHSRENSKNNGYVGQLQEEDPLGDRRALIETAEKYRQEKLEAVAEIKRLRERIAQYESKTGYKIPSPPKSSADHVSPYSDRSDSKRYDLTSDTRYHGSMYSSAHKSSGYGSRYEEPEVPVPRVPSPALSDRSDTTEYLMAPQHTESHHPHLPPPPPHHPPLTSHKTSPFYDDRSMEGKGTRHHGAFVDDEVAPSESTTDLINEIHGLNMNGHVPRPARRKSIDSTSSASSIMSDYDKELGVKPLTGSRSRPRSFDVGGKTHRSGSPTSPPRVTSPTAGLRSVSPSILVTQHNKGLIGQKREGTSTLGRRPFAPRSPGDISLEDVIKFSRQGGKISRGLVKFIGHLPGRNDTYVGVELENEEGKHDGTFEDKRYFRCKPNKGVFVAFNKIIMVYGSY